MNRNGAARPRHLGRSIFAVGSVNHAARSPLNALTPASSVPAFARSGRASYRALRYSSKLRSKIAFRPGYVVTLKFNPT